MSSPGWLSTLGRTGVLPSQRPLPFTAPARIRLISASALRLTTMLSLIPFGAFSLKTRFERTNILRGAQ